MVRREDDRSKKLADAGAEVVIADFLDEEAVHKSMQGVDVAYFCPPVFEVLLHATTVFAHCARETGVKRIINLSQWGTIDPILSPATRLHRLGEMVLDWSGVPTSHLLPAMFMEQLSLVFGAEVRQKGALIAPFDDQKVSMIAAYDVSRVAAAIALEPSRFDAGKYLLTGSANYTLEEVAGVLSDVLGKPIKYVNVDPAVWKKSWLDRGAPQHLANHLEGLYKKGRLGRLNYGPTTVVEDVTGAPATTLKEFFKKFFSDDGARFARPMNATA
jgi:uncharacterized protein YbjT (DUF2867 family)